jgi:hypothetical protein
MVEEYHQAISVSSIGGIRDTGGLYPQFGLRNSPQVLIFEILYLESLFDLETNMRPLRECCLFWYLFESSKWREHIWIIYFHFIP